VIRPSDIAARLGGDEIAILLTSADAAGAMVVADRLRASLAADNPLTDHTLTLSIGIADAAASGSNCTVAALMGMADEALYMAKARGRDRAVAHPGCVPALQLVEDEPTSPIVLAG
jgi:diguanylate cyclase (GGDEF)-like protein